MECPKCQSEKLKVIKTTSFPTCIERVRQCQECRHVWKTYEIDEKHIQYNQEVADFLSI